MPLKSRGHSKLSTALPQPDRCGWSIHLLANRAQGVQGRRQQLRFMIDSIGSTEAGNRQLQRKKTPHPCPTAGYLGCRHCLGFRRDAWIASCSVRLHLSASTTY